MRYELKDLRLFLAIAHAGNLSAGASTVHMTASSASYHLKNLEYAVGSPLFLRTPKGMVPTPAGEVLVRHAQKVLTDVDLMHQELSEFSRNLRGRVRLQANSSSLNGFVIPSIARFLASNTSVNVELTEKESSTITLAIQEGQADIGIGAGLIALPGLHRRMYALDRLVCITAKDHPIAQLQCVAFEQVLEHDLVSMNSQSSNFLFLSNQARLAGKPMNVRVQAHDFSAVLHLVQARVGISIVPASIAEEATRNDTVATVAIADVWADRTLYLVTKETTEQNDLIESFARILLNDPRVVHARGAHED